MAPEGCKACQPRPGREALAAAQGEARKKTVKANLGKKSDFYYDEQVANSHPVLTIGSAAWHLVEGWLRWCTTALQAQHARAERVALLTECMCAADAREDSSWDWKHSRVQCSWTSLVP